MKTYMNEDKKWGKQILRKVLSVCVFLFMGSYVAWAEVWELRIMGHVYEGLEKDEIKDTSRKSGKRYIGNSRSSDPYSPSPFSFDVRSRGHGRSSGSGS